jgi:CRP-like cAMP-binding protein
MAEAKLNPFELYLERFESSWRAGNPLEIRKILDAWRESTHSNPESDRALLSELVKLDLEFCWKSRPSPDRPSHDLRLADQYLREFPELRDNRDEFVIEEFRVRKRFGDQPDYSEFERRFGPLTEDFRAKLEQIEREVAFESSIQKLFDDSNLDASQPHLAPLSPPPPEQEVRHQELVRFLSETHPFSEMPADLLGQLARVAEIRCFQKGEYLIQQGGAPDSLLIVREGIAMVTVNETGGGERELARVGPHAVLGEMGLITRAERSANVIAMTECRAAIISYDVYQKLVGRFPSLNMLISELIAQRIGTVTFDVMYGKSIEGYLFKQRLGRGSMGIVYLAEDERDRRNVAIKMLRHDLVYDRQASKRFRREAQVVRQLRHPNIIRIEREFAAFNTMFLAMEFCHGIDLAQAIKQHAPFPLEVIRRILGQLAAALKHAHDRKVIHRDLKPANVMLTTHGEVKLTDFGLARSVESLNLTREGQMLGTPRYMPGELLAGGDADERADLYALGVITWEMLTGRAMFQAKDMIELIRRQMEWKLPPRDEILGLEGEDLYQLLAETTSQKIEERTLDLGRLSSWAEPVDSAFCHRLMSGVDSRDESSAESTASESSPSTYRH